MYPYRASHYEAGCSIHISQISEERVENVSDKLTEGEVVRVKVLEVDKQGRIRLSIKAVLTD